MSLKMIDFQSKFIVELVIETAKICSKFSRELTFLDIFYVMVPL